MQPCLDYVVLCEHVRRKFRRIVTANQNLHRMLLHLIADAMDVPFGYHISVIQEHNSVRHHVHFVKNMGRDNQVKSVRRQFSKQRDCFRSNHWIKTVQGFIEDHDHRLVSYRLSKANSLPHPLAVRRYFPIASIQKVHTLQSDVSQLVRFLSIVAMNEQERVNEFATCNATRERVELSTVADLLK